MNDYIRKAVELADGWEMSSKTIVTPPSTVAIGMSIHNPSTWILDALAAQLVRQVDKALKDWRCLELFEGHTAVRKFEPLSETGKDLAACYGEGRATNTIKAIVDSGVLNEQ